MITETPLSPRRSWPLALKVLIALFIAVVATMLVLLAYIILDSSDDAATHGLSISSDDPLAVADYSPGDSPLIGQHWHASYAIFIGDERQPHAPTWEGVGIHTHEDGIIHMHPFQPAEQGSGAALNKWFEYGGGELTETSMREPGASQAMTVHNGDPVPGDGRPGEIYVILNGVSFDESRAVFDEFKLVDQWIRVPIDYIPHDGDFIRIMFEPEEVMRENIQNPPSVPTPVSDQPTP